MGGYAARLHECVKRCQRLGHNSCQSSGHDLTDPKVLKESQRHILRSVRLANNQKRWPDKHCPCPALPKPGSSVTPADDLFCEIPSLRSLTLNPFGFAFPAQRPPLAQTFHARASPEGLGGIGPKPEIRVQVRACGLRIKACYRITDQSEKAQQKAFQTYNGSVTTNNIQTPPDGSA